ncbi:MAG TPA: PEP-CTERM sorting domain-containing protein [Micropepsaceae bacterium]|nr:PEP-CTERM sorting domain-containing protein [Micropepsaceae bacterium]
MFLKNTSCAAVCALALASSSVAANATVITLNDTFIASGFGAGAPFDPVTGSFSLTFDNSADITDGTAITASISIPVSGGIEFNYVKISDVLQIGGLLGGVSTISGISDDFFFNIRNVSTLPKFDGMAYSSSKSTTVAFATATGSVAATSVPEPSTLMLFGAGLLATAGFRWPKRA